MENFKKILLMAILLFPFSLLLVACDTPPPQKTQKKQNIVTKKIIKQDKNNKIERPQPEQKQAEAKQPQPQPEQKIDSDTLPKNIDLKSDIEEYKLKKFIYISEGKIDPFLSPIKKMTEKEKTKIHNRKYTPLEKLDLSQLTLVAIINMQSGKKNVAMVQESSGKGYMVKVGTYIGTNNGRIISIKNDEIIIKERIKNFKGIFEDHLKTMKLQKKDNG